MNETIAQLKEIKSRFEQLYNEKVKNADNKEIIETCLKYLDYKEHEIPSYSRINYSEGNTIMSINSLVKKNTNIYGNNHGELFNLEKIVSFLDKKIQILEKE